VSGTQNKFGVIVLYEFTDEKVRCQGPILRNRLYSTDQSEKGEVRCDFSRNIVMIVQIQSVFQKQYAIEQDYLYDKSSFNSSILFKPFIATSCATWDVEQIE
jgi:hypothetical protein